MPGVRFLHSCMNDELLEEVKSFVAEYWREPKDRLRAETSVNDDLGMDGDDGSEFMQAFGERFAVDLTDFPHDKYFGPEAGANPLSLAAGVIRCLTTGRWSDLAPLTLRALAKAAGHRRWPVELRREIYQRHAPDRRHDSSQVPALARGGG